jgi:tRNA nucleotidyltransferase/poly(A) polymerase
MNTTATAFQPNTRVGDTLGTRFTVAHDNWMADGDRFLLPVADADATFWERWAAVRYVDDQLQERFHLERALLEALRAFLTPEMNERLWMQADRLTRLLGEFARLGRQRESARELARNTRELLDALRLWYAEIELAAGGIRYSDLSREGIRLLGGLNPARCGWADAHA